MVQYRKPPQRSSNLSDRRTTTGNTPTELAQRRAAQLQRELAEMMRREAEAQLRRVRASRSRRGR